jgi:hypothetical protein
MGKAETTLARRLGMDDADLAFVYTHSHDTGGVFGLHYLNLLVPSYEKIAYEDNMYWMIHKGNIDVGPIDIDFVPSSGDISSHGATWEHLARLSTSAVSVFRQLTDSEIELHLDGLSGMAAEGARASGGGWSVIHEGLVLARRDLYDGKGYLQEPLYRGLAYIALNFDEREQALMPSIS